MTDKSNQELITAQAAEIAGLTVAITVLTHALLESCAIDKEKMLKTIDEHCAKFSQGLLGANEQIAAADRILLNIRTLVAEHEKGR